MTISSQPTLTMKDKQAPHTLSSTLIVGFLSDQPGPGTKEVTLYHTVYQYIVRGLMPSGGYDGPPDDMGKFQGFIVE